MLSLVAFKPRTRAPASIPSAFHSTGASLFATLGHLPLPPQGPCAQDFLLPSDSANSMQNSYQRAAAISISLSKSGEVIYILGERQVSLYIELLHPHQPQHLAENVQGPRLFSAEAGPTNGSLAVTAERSTPSNSKLKLNQNWFPWSRLAAVGSPDKHDITDGATVFQNPNARFLESPMPPVGWCPPHKGSGTAHLREKFGRDFTYSAPARLCFSKTHLF